MLQKVLDDRKLVQVWLTNADQQDPEIQKELKGIYAKYKGTKYLVVVYKSGREDLYQNTLALLLHNREASARREIQQEKAASKSHARER